MKRSSAALLLVAVFALPAQSQPVPRVKGRIVDFDGLTFHLAPNGGGAPIAVRLLPDTRFATVETRALSAFRPGVFAGATVTDKDGVLTAEEVHLYPDALRGSGEGRLAQGNGRFVINGAVTAVGQGSITLFYRGATEVDGICLDRADPKAPSPACSADPVIEVPKDAAITALVAADRRLLVPGAIATVSIMTGAKGLKTTPGLIIQKSVIVEKPQNPQ